jgi:hypothetical protein
MTDDAARHDRALLRILALQPAVKAMLAVSGSTPEDVARTLRVAADLVDGTTDPAEEEGRRRLAEEVAKAFAAEGVPVTKVH